MASTTCRWLTGPLGDRSGKLRQLTGMEEAEQVIALLVSTQEFHRVIVEYRSHWKLQWTLYLERYLGLHCITRSSIPKVSISY